jgi:hypothetical protein
MLSGRGPHTPVSYNSLQQRKDLLRVANAESAPDKLMTAKEQAARRSRDRACMAAAESPRKNGVAVLSRVSWNTETSMTDEQQLKPFEGHVSTTQCDVSSPWQSWRLQG